MGVEIRPLSGVEARGALDDLVAILVDCVAGGASINFMAGFGAAEARPWWEGVLAAEAAGRLVLLGAWLDGALVGSAQLGLDVPPNQLHRADVKKVIVATRARGRGVGAALMGAVEAEARRRGLALLVLDTAAGSDAERLYARQGWHRAGTIPGYALFPDGRPCDTVFFWKEL